MKTKNQKLDFFLHLAFMDQQLGLAVYEDEEALEQIKDFIEKENGVPPIAVRSLQDITNTPRGAWGIFPIPAENREELFSKLPSLPFPSGIKILFVLKQAEFEKMDDTTQTSLLATFQPIYRP